MLLEEPTIEHVAIALGKHSHDAHWSAVVPLQPGGTKPPLFVVHGLGGYVSCFAELSNRLGVDQPSYGIQARGLDGVQEPLTTVDEMAKAYLAEVRSIQEHGPYYLAGFSTGGAIALEMAQQLHAEGQDVNFLAMVDCAPVTLLGHRRRWRPRSVGHFLSEFPFWSKVLLSLSVKEKVASAKYAWAFVSWTLQDRLTRRFSRLLPTAPLEAAENLGAPDPLALPEHHLRLRKALFQAGLDYKPRPFKGRITLLRSTRFLFAYSFDRRYGWDEFALGGVDVEMVEGDHESILAEPLVSALAEKLGRHLKAAQARRRRPDAPRAGGVPARPALAAPSGYRAERAAR
jgi:thioesterase domain-containing protein